MQQTLTLLAGDWKGERERETDRNREKQRRRFLENNERREKGGAVEGEVAPSLLLLPRPSFLWFLSFFPLFSFPLFSASVLIIQYCSVPPLPCPPHPPPFTRTMLLQRVPSCFHNERPGCTSAPPDWSTEPPPLHTSTLESFLVFFLNLSLNYSITKRGR